MNVDGQFHIHGKPGVYATSYVCRPTFVVGKAVTMQMVPVTMQPNQSLPGGAMMLTPGSMFYPGNRHQHCRSNRKQKCRSKKKHKKKEKSDSESEDDNEAEYYYMRVRGHSQSSKLSLHCVSKKRAPFLFLS